MIGAFVGSSRSDKIWDIVDVIAAIPESLGIFSNSSSLSTYILVCLNDLARSMYTL